MPGKSPDLSETLYNFDLVRRWQIGVAFLPALLMLVLVPFCVESPRYLLKKARFKVCNTQFMLSLCLMQQID